MEQAANNESSREGKSTKRNHEMGLLLLLPPAVLLSGWIVCRKFLPWSLADHIRSLPIVLLTKVNSTAAPLDGRTEYFHLRSRFIVAHAKIWRLWNNTIKRSWQYVFRDWHQGLILQFHVGRQGANPCLWPLVRFSPHNRFLASFY